MYGLNSGHVFNINYVTFILHFITIQPEHPTPGKWFDGINRTGHFPDSLDGRKIVKMLRVAFERKLVFTIGHSRTTGHEGVVTWNDIHHKTRTHGGPQEYVLTTIVLPLY
jgi:hypothetical protein